MKIEIFHYDMTNRELVIAIGFKPDPVIAEGAYAKGEYTKAYEVEVDDHLVTNAALEEAFVRTQDTGRARSTSVGDILIVSGEQTATQAYIVDTCGFRSITI